MSEISFPLKDLARRKFKTGLMILGLAISASGTFFLVIFGSSLGFEISFLAMSGRLTSGFFTLFSQFVLIVGLLNILTGAVITSFIVYLAMSERLIDIGVMKAIGCLRNSILAYFLTELSLLIFVSCTIGLFLGLGAYFLSISLLNWLGFSVLHFPTLMATLLVFLIVVVVSHIVGVLPIRKAIKQKPIEVLSPLLPLGTNIDSGRLRKFISSKLGITFNVAYRTLTRREASTTQAILCLGTVLTLTTVTIAGGLVANETTRKYVERAIGNDVVVVGAPPLVRRYRALLSTFFELPYEEAPNYLDPAFFMPDTLIDELRNIPGVQKVDHRFILESPVHEIPGIISDPLDPNMAIQVGDSRFNHALVLGVDPEAIVNDWLVQGAIFDSTDEGIALIGDSLAVEMFDKPQNQSISIFGDIYQISGVCLDPLNNGKVVYLPLNTVSERIGPTGYNLVLLKIDTSENPQLFTALNQTLSGLHLELVRLNDTLRKFDEFLNSIWSMILPMPVFSLATATFCLLSYLQLSISGQQQEFCIMRALGLKPTSIVNIVLTQALLITLISGTLGTSLGLVVTYIFVIPEPVFSSLTILAVLGWLLLSVSLLCLASLYPAKRAAKASIGGTTYSA